MDQLAAERFDDEEIELPTETHGAAAWHGTSEQEERPPVSRKRKAMTWALVLVFALWLFVRLQPLIIYLTQGIVVAPPHVPITFPPVAWDSLFTRQTFLHYGWIALVVAYVVYDGFLAINVLLLLSGFLGIAFIAVAWLDAVFTDSSYGYESTADVYKGWVWLMPLAMPMEKFRLIGWIFPLVAGSLWGLWASLLEQRGRRSVV